jgi:hypothetical protein
VDLIFRFSASEHRNALTMSPKGSAMDCACRPRHTDVPSGDRKGKTAKRRVNALIGWPSFWYFFLATQEKVPEGHKYLAWQGENELKLPLR